MSQYTVECDRCDYREGTDSYERARDLVDQHHIPTGHHPAIEEHGQRGKYTVDCDRCNYRESSDSYERAKRLAQSHNTVSGHRPVVEE